MKITVMGAILIIVAVIAGVFVLRALNGDAIDNQNGVPGQDQSSQNGTGA